MKLTKYQRSTLQRMVDNQDDREGELVCGHPGGWYLGDDRVPGKTAYFFLRNCLIRRCSFSDETYEVFVATEYTRKALTDPEWSLQAEIEASKILT